MAGSKFVFSNPRVERIVSGRGSIEKLAEEFSTSSRKTNALVIQRAKELGIVEGNSLYCYQNTTFHEEIPGSLYNGLRFLGSFPDPHRKIR